MQKNDLCGALIKKVHDEIGKKSILSIHPKDFTVGNKVCAGILAIGIPASVWPQPFSFASSWQQ